MDAVKAFLIGIGVLLVGLVGVTIYLFIPKEPDPVETKSAGGGIVLPPECEDGTRPCGRGQQCVEGFCMRWDPPACGKDQPCSDKCTCEGNFKCDAERVCRVQAPSADEVCKDPRVVAAVKRLAEECPGGDLKACKPDEWAKFVMKEGRFDELIANFPDKITIHFDIGFPRTDTSWPPDRDIEAHYLEGLRKHRAALERAEVIFVIGRASPIGNWHMNRDLAFRRMNAADLLIAQALQPENAGGIKQSELDAKLKAINDKLKHAALGQDRPLNLGFFTQHYGKNIVLWSQEQQERLGRALALGEQGDVIAEKEKAWAFATLNQVAIVVPVPCGGAR